MFDETEYKKRNNEGIFGAEETKNHWLHWWFKSTSMRRFDKIRGITRNLKVPNASSAPKSLAYPYRHTRTTRERPQSPSHARRRRLACQHAD